ncbi:tetratricopeptide repeat protein [Saccharothrix obliqua]|uniref:tetratricopeptide repeat protein n=1 Tax=Saccharothrix obliqua TaxID=2861747 RepID=UPI001C5E8DE2|nr:tetratricopeptide repeat protein [Saccharothrix obliqua]MBW4720455.1 sel1 repeat family protein [Saccharothrix obliqua]
MGASSYETLSRLLAEENSGGAELFTAACALRDAFVRNEHLIGLLPGDAPALLVAGLERAGHAGVVDAWLELGRLRAHGAAPWAPYPDQDLDAAITAYRNADRAGSAAGALGWIRVAYFARSAVHATDAAERLDQLLAADPENADALVLAGYLAHQGYGRPADPAAAVRYQLAAAERGHADAAFELSVLHSTGDGVPADEDESMRWTTRAAELGSARAMANLAGMHATGRGVPHDPAIALDWYARAAEAGHAKAAYTAGVMCLVGDGGLPVDRDQAEGFLVLAEELGFDVDGTLGAMGLTR